MNKYQSMLHIPSKHPKRQNFASRMETKVPRDNWMWPFWMRSRRDLIEVLELG